MRSALAVVGGLFVVFVVLEIGASFLTDFHIDKPGLDGHPTVGRAQGLAPYRLRLVKKEWHNAQLNIDRDGFRSGKPTGALFDDWDASRFNVLGFGGSAMFGFTVDDSKTITAALETKAQQAGLPWRVFNLGITDYSIHDELPILVDQLREGRIPRAVIFYDGVNEAGRGIENRTNNEALNAPYRAADYEYFGVLDQYDRGLTANLDRLAAAKLAGRLCRRAGLCSGWHDTPPPADTAAIDAHAKAAAQAYVQYVKMVRALADGFGFTTLFVLQPIGGCLEDPKGYPYPYLSPPRDWQMVYAPKLYAEIRATMPAGIPFVDLCPQVRELVKKGWRPFSTPLHLNPEGNAWVASVIFDRLHFRDPSPIKAKAGLRRQGPGVR